MANIVNTYWLKEGIDGGQNADGIITQSENCRLVFDEVITTIPEAIAASGFRAGQVHRTSDFMFLGGEIGATVDSDSNGLSWVFDLNYTTVSYESNSNDPVTYRPKVSISKWTYSRTVDFDKLTDLPIELPTGEKYDPPLMEQISAPIIHVTVRENSANISRIADIGSINNAAISICGIDIPAYCGMFDDYTTEPHWDEEGYLTFLNTYAIKCKFLKSKTGVKIGFMVEALAASFNQKVNGELLEITVKSITTAADPGATPPVEEVSEQVPVATPQKIDENGELTDTAYYQYWVPQDLISFSGFGLPSSYPVN
jgi:hypothetical protein